MHKRMRDWADGPGRNRERGCTASHGTAPFLIFSRNYLLSYCNFLAIDNINARLVGGMDIDTAKGVDGSIAN